MISKGRETDLLVSEIGNICCEDGGVGISKFARIVSLVMSFEQSEENEWATSKGREIDLLISEIGNFCCEDGGVGTNKSV